MQSKLQRSVDTGAVKGIYIFAKPFSTGVVWEPKNMNKSPLGYMVIRIVKPKLYAVAYPEFRHNKSVSVTNIKLSLICKILELFMGLGLSAPETFYSSVII